MLELLAVFLGMATVVGLLMGGASYLARRAGERRLQKAVIAVRANTAAQRDRMVKETRPQKSEGAPTIAALAGADIRGDPMWTDLSDNYDKLNRIIAALPDDALDELIEKSRRRDLSKFRNVLTDMDRIYSSANDELRKRLQKKQQVELQAVTQEAKEILSEVVLKAALADAEPTQP